MNYQFKWASVGGPFNFGKEGQPSFERRPLSFHPTRVFVKKLQKGHVMIMSVPIDINLLLVLLRKLQSEGMRRWICG
jgi:hypothetical protein